MSEQPVQSRVVAPVEVELMLFKGVEEFVSSANYPVMLVEPGEIVSLEAITQGAAIAPNQALMGTQERWLDLFVYPVRKPSLAGPGPIVLGRARECHVL